MENKHIRGSDFPAPIRPINNPVNRLTTTEWWTTELKHDGSWNLRGRAEVILLIDHSAGRTEPAEQSEGETSAKLQNSYRGDGCV